MCSPVGMSDGDRAEWVRVARITLRDLPLDLLRAGCEVARKEADHPAKIVPLIHKTTAPILKARRENLVPPERRIAPPEPEYCTPEQAREVLERYGFEGIGTKAKIDRGPPKMPTAEDYAAMGYDTGQGFSA